jgi:hypothetical protein
MLAYWLAGFINPAFSIIAVLIVFFIPIFLTDYSYLDTDTDDPSNSPDRHAPGSGHTSSAAASKQSDPENRISSTSRLLKEAEHHVDKTGKDTKNANKPKTPNKH